MRILAFLLLLGIIGYVFVAFSEDQSKILPKDSSQEDIFGEKEDSSPGLKLSFREITERFNFDTKDNDIEPESVNGGNKVNSPKEEDKNSSSDSLSQRQAEPNQISDQGSVGSMGHHYLHDGIFQKMIVEIDYLEGKRPSGLAKNTLLSSINKYAEKPQGISIVENGFEGTAKSSYSISDIRELVKVNREHYSGDGVAVMHILYLNGKFAGNENALGIAYNGSSVVIFKDQIEKAITALVLSSNIERAVLVHEFGHLLGLVNINYQSDIDHEDDSHKGHSKNKESVMYWAVEDVNVANVLKFGPPYQFDSDDELDIEKIKSGN